MKPEGSLSSSEEPLDTILSQLKPVHTFTSSLQYVIHPEENILTYSLFNPLI
jgi:hypothetical protein